MHRKDDNIVVAVEENNFVAVKDDGTVERARHPRAETKSVARRARRRYV